MKLSLVFIISALLLQISFNQLSGQVKGKGLPFIVNHSQSSYQAGTQNWAITQCDKGFVYFANNDGILEFDGTSWRVFPVSNVSVVRSVLAVGDRVYAGAFEEIGYLAPNDKGQMEWNSLNSLIPPEFAGFDEVWRIFYHEGRVIFQSFSYIFIFHDNKMEVIEPLAGLSFMHRVRGNFYVVEKGKGLMVLRDDSLHLVSNNPVFFRNEVMFILPHSRQQLLIGTSNEGLFILDGTTLVPWQSQVNRYFEQHKLFSGILLDDGNFAFGTVRDGLYITNPEGQVLQHINRFKGLQNNTVLALFQDRRANLWIGLDNGIDLVEISSPVTIFNHVFNIGSVYASIVHDNNVYVGTNQGLFVAPLHRLEDQTGPNIGFSLINGTEGQVWSLQVIDNTLFCGHNNGCFVIEGYTARSISTIRGFWSFVLNPFNSSQVIAGTYTGLVLLQREGKNWVFYREIEGFSESSRHFYIDHLKNIWVAHGYRGLFKLTPDEGFQKINNVDIIRNQLGLPYELPYNMNVIDNQMVISSREGIFKFDYAENRFKPHPQLSNIFQGKGFVNILQQDDNGNLWYFMDDYMGLMRRLEDGTFRDVTSPFSRVNQFLLPAFQNIFVKSNDNIFIGSQNGLVHYNASILHAQKDAEQVFFREIVFEGRDGTKEVITLKNSSLNDSEHLLSFANNSVSFLFTTPVFQNPGAIRFSYRLQGFDTGWSGWSASNFKEYTNLKEGEYIFEVKAINAFGVESPVSQFKFTIAPPWHRSKAAYIVYGLFLLCFLIGNVYYVRIRILRGRQREKIRLEKRLSQRENLFREQNILSEKEILHLRNETLRMEMDHKNKELANATLHLIQKNKTLSDLQNDLSKLSRRNSPDSNEKQVVNNLLKKIKKDLRSEKSWEVFNSYFDEVHQDFISRLKEKYTELSPNDLRLCAYLRMNISSKEIASLMNISVRGVEISRYRLRKKLKLSNQTNLTEFIITF